MNKFNTGRDRQGEKGNVLFLILIAVALFAALSYAVTQSTRSGSGDASGETNLINSAQLAQYPAGVRTAIVRMIISGTQVDQLLFNSPTNFTNIPSDNEPFGVFHPEGGGAVFAAAPLDMMANTDNGGNNLTGMWIFNMHTQIQDVGLTDPANNTGNDLVAFLPGVTANVCRKIDQEVGIIGSGSSAIPVGPTYTPNPTDATQYMDEDYTIPATPVAVIGDGSSSAFQGQPFGCYANGSTYTYYHVLVER